MAASDSPVFVSAEKTVASAGTAEALVAASRRVKSVTVMAKRSNTGAVFLGGADVAATTNDGIEAGDSLILEPVEWLDLVDVYIDVDVSGEGVDFYAVKA